MSRPVTLAPEQKRTPWYFLSLLFFFLLPLIGFFATQWKKIDQAAFLKAVMLITLLGWLWSMLVSSQGWWVFNPQTMLGLRVLPFLPLEEALFYPLGGALSIFIYFTAVEHFPQAQPSGRSWLFLMVIFTLVAGAVTLVSLLLGHRPYYLVSQLILFNGLSLGAWVKVRERLFWKPLLVAALLMTLVGFSWDWIAFTRGWWEYRATLGLMFPPQVPVDDWNFFFFAPVAAASLYTCFKRR